MDTLCKCFKKMIRNNFVSFYTDGNVLLMPYIQNSNHRYNNCPCCGQSVRDLELTEQERDLIIA